MEPSDYPENSHLIKYTEGVLINPKVDGLKEELFKRIASQSRKETPKSFVKQKAGMDYLEEEFMRSELNRLAPMAWSWIEGMVEIYSATLPIWVVATGTLVVFRLETGREQRFTGHAAHRIAYKKDKPYTPDNIVDLGNDVKSANSDAFKVAVNRLMNIGDDVYRKEMIEFWNLTEEEEAIKALIVSCIDFKHLKRWNEICEAGHNNGKSFKETVRDIWRANLIKENNSAIIDYINKEDL